MNSIVRINVKIVHFLNHLKFLRFILVQIGTKLSWTYFKVAGLFLIVKWVKFNFKPPVGKMTLSHFSANSHFGINLGTNSSAIGKLDDVPSEIFPRMSINTFLIIVLPINWTKFSFVLKHHEIVIKVQSTQNFDFNFVSGVSRMTENAIGTIRWI